MVTSIGTVSSAVCCLRSNRDVVTCWCLRRWRGCAHAKRMMTVWCMCVCVCCGGAFAMTVAAAAAASAAVCVCLNKRRRCSRPKTAKLEASPSTNVYLLSENWYSRNRHRRLWEVFLFFFCKYMTLWRRIRKAKCRRNAIWFGVRKLCAARPSLLIVRFDVRNAAMIACTAASMRVWAVPAPYVCSVCCCWCDYRVVYARKCRPTVDQQL